MFTLNVSRAIPNILEVGGQILNTACEAHRKNFGHAHKSLTTPSKSLLGCVSMRLVRFLLNAEVCVLTVVTADSRTPDN